MKIISLEEFLRKKELWEVLRSAIVVYPTDTVYGIGCNAECVELVEKIYEIKKRPIDKSLSIIAPDFEWIAKYCVVKDLETLKRFLPGAYTVILKKKTPEFLSHLAKGENIGIRIISHPLQKVFETLYLPFVTTSANISGEKPAKRIDEIPEEVLEKCDLIINGGELPGKPSTIVYLTDEEMKFVER